MTSYLVVLNQVMDYTVDFLKLFILIINLILGHTVWTVDYYIIYAVLITRIYQQLFMF